MKRLRTASPACRGQRGQAYAEYVVMLVVVILLLIVGGDSSPINLLIGAFKSFYQSYSFAIAVP
ncbi:hypothetical protein OR16_28869 [Cupriavidus basilensis OR16]|uniref:Uncharacterized protein n=1 Tax=Cupriavidus basilensis OR16 TaxID=1127483 RepID=H1SC42_9BURK|nr:hypothetical protein [Cupriavidus basilensis]EHP39915.1 hypothetical protein OR16_28869 [Cupriavidus basilensis OR16]